MFCQIPNKRLYKELLKYIPKNLRCMTCAVKYSDGLDDIKEGLVRISSR